MWDVLGVGFVVVLFVGPLVTAAWWDWRCAEGQAVRAELDWEIGRGVGRGLFAVRTVPGLLRGGRVYLDGEGFPEEWCRRALAIARALVPTRYEVRQAGGAASWLAACLARRAS